VEDKKDSTVLNNLSVKIINYNPVKNIINLPNKHQAVNETILNSYKQFIHS